MRTPARRTSPRGVSPQWPVPEAELAAAAVRDLLAHQSADFDAAAQRVLEKNQELYQRLA